MFDDQPINNNQIPNNLPVGEPEDMFATVDSGNELPQSPILPGPVEVEVGEEQKPRNALDAGVLKPKFPSTDMNSTMNQIPVNQPSPMDMPQPNNPMEMNAIKEPKVTRGIMITVMIFLIVIILGAIGWWFYNNFVVDNNGSLPVDNNVDLVVPSGLDGEENQMLTDETVNNTAEITEDDTDSLSELSQDIVDEQILFGEPIDKDADGLDDARELDIGTDPNNWDTDGDELSDGDEVIIWKTDPVNPDSDGDSYLDGLEVKSGYNPAGPGKIFEVPNE